MARLGAPFPLALAAALCGLTPGAAQESQVPVSDRTGLAVTVYQGDLAFVRDRRRVSLDAGDNTLAFVGLSERLRPDTVVVQPLDGGPLAVNELDFDARLLTPAAMLEAAVGGFVTVIRDNPATGEETRERAMVLSTADGVVLRFDDRIEVGVPGRLVFDEMPSGLRASPTQVVSVSADASARQGVELSYLTGGLSWHADYTVVLDPSGERASVLGWANVLNATGTPFEDARLSLVAGRVGEERAPEPLLRAQVQSLSAPSPEALGVYQQFTIAHPVTLKPQQSKRLALLAAEVVPVSREYRLEGAPFAVELIRMLQTPRGVKVRLAFTNSAENGLGGPLPAGAVRVFGVDQSGEREFLGAASMTGVPDGGRVEVDYGEAFDITARRTVTDAVRGARGAHSIVIANATEEAVTVDIHETFPAGWRILTESREHTRESAFTAVWRVEVAAGGKSELTYRARVDPAR